MLKVSHLSKSYPNFELKDISFEIPAGYIVGFLGKNGAGKTTTIKSILNITHPDGGEISLDGLDIQHHELELKQNIGSILGAFDYFPKTRVAVITQAYRDFYSNWDQTAYQKYIDKFGIDETKHISDLSTGTKVKYGLALAMSHHAKILLLDEPTSGLDPIARDELLDIFREIIQDEETGILFSTHITSDLDKCADFVLILKNGRLIAYDTKDNLINTHTLIRGNLDALTPELKTRAVAIKQNQFGFCGLIKTDLLDAQDRVTRERPNLEDIMLYYNQEAKDD